jgi:hypothetical protein
MSTAVVKAELAKQEAVIEHGRGDFVAVGRALAAINDETLYTGAGFTTFDDYWTARWAELFGFGARYARHQIEAVEVVNALGPIRTQIKTETQARAIAPLVLGRGKALLVEQGEGKFSRGRIEELSNALELSPAELYNRRQFAKTFPTEEQVRDAFRRWGSWYAICNRGLGRRGLRKGRMQKKDDAETWGDDLSISIAHKAYQLLCKEADESLSADTLDFAMTDVLWEPTPESRMGVLYPEEMQGLDPYQFERLLRTFVELRYRVDRCVAAFRRKLDGWQVTWDKPGPTLLDIAKSDNNPITPEPKVARSENRTPCPVLSVNP